MPANKKYLTKSPWTKFSKILAGSVGGYLVMISFHAALTKILPQDYVMVTSFVTGYLLWATLPFIRVHYQASLENLGDLYSIIRDILRHLYAANKLTYGQ